jgi:hypothetical protein
MATTYTTNISLSKQGDGDNSTTWGQVANTVFDLIDTAVAGISTKATADADVTLTSTSGAANESRAMILKLTGTLTAIRTITVPAVSQVHVIWNACTGYAISVKASGGSNTVSVGIGEKKFIFCDGTECYDAVGSIYVSAPARLLGRTTAGAGNSEEIDINALTVDSAPAPAADYLLSYDASAAAFKKVLHRNIKPTESMMIAVGDESTVLTTGSAKVAWRMPYAFTVTAVRSSVRGASSSGLVTVDINQTGTTMLSTKLSIDANEVTSTTAATPAVISTPSLSDDESMTIDIDAAGTGAYGLKVTLIGYRT